MRIAYADPPYLGCGASLYGFPEWDDVDRHYALIRTLTDDFPDGWALSAHAPSLQTLLPLCPRDVRVSPWVKSWCSFKPGVNPAFAWEPVIWRGGRRDRSREEPTVRDWVLCPATRGRGLAGAKPDEFCFWLFELLGLEEDDEFHDLFPGTGAVTRAWNAWSGQRTLPIGAPGGDR